MTDKMGRPAKLVNLEWNRKEDKIEEILQVGEFKAPQKDNFINIFEVEYGDRMKFVQKMTKLCDTIKENLLGQYSGALRSVFKLVFIARTLIGSCNLSLTRAQTDEHQFENHSK